MIKLLRALLSHVTKASKDRARTTCLGNLLNHLFVPTGKKCLLYI